MLHTGQRPGAVEQLTWFQVDFDEAVIHFDRDGKEQTNKRKATVAMTDEVYDLLTELYKKKETSYVLGHPGKARRAMENAYKKAGIEKASRYTLRHTALDRLGEVESDRKIITDIAGHTSEQTTLRHYRKSKIERQRKALNKMWSTTQKQRKSKNDKL
jgi:integrase